MSWLGKRSGDGVGHQSEPVGNGLGARWLRTWRRSLLHRLAMILAIVLVVWEVMYVVAANVMLRGEHLERLVNGASEDLHLQIGSAWSAWPGRVHAKQVEFRFQDRNIEFSVALDSAVLNISLWQLPTKTFHVTTIRGEGTRYLFRHKVESAEGLERRLAQYPKIPGFADPPLITKPKTPPLSDEEYNLWTIQLGDVDVGVRELWFLEYRFVGTGRAQGGFRIKPERSAHTDPCSLTLDGTLKGGQAVVASKLVGRIDAQLDQHDPRVVQGEQIFSKISARFDLRGAVPNLDFTKLYTTEGGPSLSRGEGTLQIRLDLKHGHWSQGSRVEYDTDAITVAQDKLAFAGPATLSAEIVQGGKDSKVEMALQTQHVALSYDGTPKNLEAPSVRGVRAAVGATADLTRPLKLVSVRGDLRASVPQLRWLNHPLEKQLWSDGSAQGDAHVTWAEGKLAAGNLGLELKRAVMPVEEGPVQLSGNLIAALTYDADAQRGRADKLTLDVPQLLVAGEPLTGGVHAHSERLSWQGNVVPERLSGRVIVESGTLAPLLPLVISSDILRSLAKAVVNLGKTRAEVEFDHTPAASELRLEQGRSGDVQAFGIWRHEKQNKDMCGRVFVDGAISVGLLMDAGETSVKPLVDPSWWRERPAVLRCSTAPKPEKPVHTASRDPRGN